MQLRDKQLGEAIKTLNTITPSYPDYARVKYQIAEACLAVALAATPGSDRLAVVGMGKLGGAELNYSSDVDLLFVHRESGPHAQAEASAAAAQLIELLTQPTADGLALRIDANLRPGGRSAPLSRSLGAMAEYYERHAETWERQAGLAWVKDVGFAIALATDLVKKTERRAYNVAFEGVSVRRLVEFTWKYYLAHPEFLTLLNSENLHRARHLKRSRDVRAMNSPVIETLSEVLARGRRRGDFRSGVDALQLYISIAALSYFYLGNNDTLSAVFGRDLSTAKAKRERLAHMTDVVLGYLRPPFVRRLTAPARNADN